MKRKREWSSPCCADRYVVTIPGPSKRRNFITVMCWRCGHIYTDKLTNDQKKIEKLKTMLDETNLKWFLKQLPNIAEPARGDHTGMLNVQNRNG